MNEVWIGVISGVLTTALLFACRSLVVHALAPWWASLTYQGIHVDGVWTWKGETPAKTPYSCVLTLRQSGTRVSGELRTTISDPNRPSTPDEHHRVGGQVVGAVLTLHGVDRERRRAMNPIVFMFTSGADGDVLKGVWAWLSGKLNVVSHVDIVAVRT